MLAELERGPTAQTGANDNHLIRRKKMVEELIIEESRHEAVEKMYFWPAVRDRLPEVTSWRTPPPARNRRARKSWTGWTS
jgi:hypothetical protein